MPHEIANIAGRAAMAYQNEMPWHKLGTEMHGTIDVGVALKQANLNWEISLEPMFAKREDGSWFPVPDRQAVWRNIDRQVIATVGSQYTVLQNADAFGVLDKACEEFGVTIETAGALGTYGTRVWMLAKLPNSSEVLPGDKVDGYFLITTSHDGSAPYVAKPTPIRVVCANTLNMAESRGVDFVRLAHKPGQMAEFSEVEEFITNMVKALSLSGETFGMLAQKEMTRETLEAYVDAVLGVPEMDTYLEELFELESPIPEKAAILWLAENGIGSEMAKGTAWGAYNAVTEYFDHVRPASVKTEKAAYKANVSTLFGKNSAIKERALTLAVRA